MSDFFTVLDEYLDSGSDNSDIRVVARRCWFYDFIGCPLRFWQGQGRLHTTDDNVWLGTMDENGRDIHNVPALTDGRDGSSASYNFSLLIPDLPGQPAQESYEMLKKDQWRVTNQELVCYFAIFQVGEALRPETPIMFYKDLTMKSVKFSEKIATNSDGTLVKSYVATVVAKDGNFGRSNIPNGTYTDTIQKARAKDLGVALDRGVEFLARLANRTYQLP